MKILIVSNTIWSIYNFRLGLMKKLKAKGFEVTAVAPNESREFYGLVEKEGFRIIELKNLGRKSMNPFKDLALFVELFKIYKREKPDLTIHYTIKPNIYGNLAARLAKIKSIGVITGVGYLFNIESPAIAIAKILYRFALKRPQKVVFQNENNRSLFLKEELVDKNRTVLIKSSGVDTEKFSPDYCLPAEALAQEGLSVAIAMEKIKKEAGKIVCLQSARMLWDKGVGEFVEAAKIVKKNNANAEFWLLGQIDEGNPAAVSLADIKKWEEEGSVKYLGETNEVRPYICACDAAVLASYHEGAPKSLLEAMAMGKPIITTDAPGCKDAVEDGKNGFMARAKNAPALAEAMIKMIKAGVSGREEMGRYSRGKVVKEFDEKIVVGQYLSLIKEITG